MSLSASSDEHKVKAITCEVFLLRVTNASGFFNEEDLRGFEDKSRKSP